MHAGDPSLGRVLRAWRRAALQLTNGEEEEEREDCDKYPGVGRPEMVLFVLEELGGRPVARSRSAALGLYGR